MAVDVAQSAEPLVVVQVVVGSNPIIHPIFFPFFRLDLLLFPPVAIQSRNGLEINS